MPNPSLPRNPPASLLVRIEILDAKLAERQAERHELLAQKTFLEEPPLEQGHRCHVWR